MKFFNFKETTKKHYSKVIQFVNFTKSNEAKEIKQFLVGAILTIKKIIFKEYNNFSNINTGDLVMIKYQNQHKKYFPKHLHQIQILKDLENLKNLKNLKTYKKHQHKKRIIDIDQELLGMVVKKWDGIIDDYPLYENYIEQFIYEFTNKKKFTAICIICGEEFFIIYDIDCLSGLEIIKK